MAMKLKDKINRYINQKITKNKVGIWDKVNLRK